MLAGGGAAYGCVQDHWARPCAYARHRCDKPEGRAGHRRPQEACSTPVRAAAVRRLGQAPAARRQAWRPRRPAWRAGGWGLPRPTLSTPAAVALQCGSSSGCRAGGSPHAARSCRPSGILQRKQLSGVPTSSRPSLEPLCAAHLPPWPPAPAAGPAAPPRRLRPRPLPRRPDLMGRTHHLFPPEVCRPRQWKPSPPPPPRAAP